MVAPTAGHIAHLLARSVTGRQVNTGRQATRGDTVQQMLSFFCDQPTLEEGSCTALRDLQHRLQPGPRSPTPDDAAGSCRTFFDDVGVGLRHVHGAPTSRLTIRPQARCSGLLCPSREDDP